MKTENQLSKIKPADRLASVSEYYFSKKLKEVAQMNAEGKDVISLGIGSPDMPPSESTIQTLCDAARNPDGHGYQPYVGIPELRRGFAGWYKRWYDVELDPNTEIQPLIGSKEGILHVTLAFVNPGEQVLVPNPGYPTYTSLSRILGAEVVNYNLKEENGWLLLQVSDTGIGIPINKQGKIFERFYQIESEHVGSGIGLSLVQRLIELHHGRIELDSEENKGSTFSVYLPQDLSVYKPSELASNNEQNEEEQVYSTNSKAMYFIDTEKVENESVESGDKKRGTILIVEDNNEIRRYLSNGLADLFNTLEAGNGEEALEKLKDNEVDVIVTDVMMPVMDGIKLCKNVKQNIRTCHIPVIILSAKTDIKDQMEGLQMGADDYIPKPFSLAILTTKIQNMMRTRRRMLDKYAKSLEVEPEKITFNAMDEALLKRAMAIVEKNMDNIEFSTDEFAREMNMSRSNLHLKLKAITGESTIDFIRKIRFNEAAKLLKDGRYTVAEVSTMVGFNTPSYFATSFKKYFGCLPTEYIKKSKG